MASSVSEFTIPESLGDFAPIWEPEWAIPRTRSTTESPFSTRSMRSELLDGGFVLQQDGDVVADGIHALALVALQGVFAAHDERLPANRTGENLQQFGGDHAAIVAERPLVAIRFSPEGAAPFRLLLFGRIANHCLVLVSLLARLFSPHLRLTRTFWRRAKGEERKAITARDKIDVET